MLALQAQTEAPLPKNVGVGGDAHVCVPAHRQPKFVVKYTYFYNHKMYFAVFQTVIKVKITHRTASRIQQRIAQNCFLSRQESLIKPT